MLKRMSVAYFELVTEAICASASKADLFKAPKVMTDFLANDTNFGILLAQNAFSSSQILIVMCVKFIKEIH